MAGTSFTRSFRRGTSAQFTRLVCSFFRWAPLYWGWWFLPRWCSCSDADTPPYTIRTPLGRARMRLALVALAVFLLCFTTPILEFMID